MFQSHQGNYIWKRIHWSRKNTCFLQKLTRKWENRYDKNLFFSWLACPKTTISFQVSSTYPQDQFHLIKSVIQIILIIIKLLSVKLQIFKNSENSVKVWQILNKIVKIVPLYAWLGFKWVPNLFPHFLRTQKCLSYVLEAIRRKTIPYFWHVSVLSLQSVKKYGGLKKN